MLLTAFFIAIFTIILDYFIGYVQEEYASKRPRLEHFGLRTDSWLGSVHHRRATDRSPVIDAVSCVHVDGIDQDDRNHQIHDDSNPNDDDRGVNISHNNRSNKSMKKITETEKLHQASDTDLDGTPAVHLKIAPRERDFISVEVFNNYLTPREECNRLISRVEEFLGNMTRSGSSCDLDPDIDLSHNDRVLSYDHIVAMNAMRSQLMVNFDGTMIPITLRQRIFYTDRQDLIEKKIIAARAGAMRISQAITEMEVQDNNLKDIALMRNFIIEQISIFYRFSMKKNFRKIDGAVPESINALIWLLAWVLIIGVLFFFLLWIFLWGVKNGNATLHSWGTDYGVAAIQDICVCEVLKLCIMFIFAVMSAKPQLHVIKRIINERALSLVQDGSEFNSKVSVVQHFSPACRAARLSSLSDLPSAAILRCMTDADIDKCKQHKNFTLGRVIFYTVIVAAMIAALSEELVDQMLDIILTSALLGFLLLNEQAINISPAILIVVYGVVGGTALYHLLVFVPSVRQARQARAQRAYASQDFARTRGRNAVKVNDTSMPLVSMRRLKVICDLLIEYVGVFNTIISGDWTSRKREKEWEDESIWCGMNKASALHGLIGKSRTIPRSASPRSSPRSSRSGSRFRTNLRSRSRSQRSVSPHSSSKSGIILPRSSHGTRSISPFRKLSNASSRTMSDSHYNTRSQPEGSNVMSLKVPVDSLEFTRSTSPYIQNDESSSLDDTRVGLGFPYDMRSESLGLRATRSVSPVRSRFDSIYESREEEYYDRESFGNSQSAKSQYNRRPMLPYNLNTQQSQSTNNMKSGSHRRAIPLYKGPGITIGTHEDKNIIPITVRNMRQSGESFRRDRPLAKNQDTVAVKSVSVLPIVILGRDSRKLARQYRANHEITTDPVVALKRLLDRHILGAEAYKNGIDSSVFEHPDESDVYIIITELSELVEWSWDTFYPGGREMTDELKLEVDEQLQRWFLVQNHLPPPSIGIQKIKSMAGIHHGVQFSEFSEWFLSICDKIEMCMAPLIQEDFVRLNYQYFDTIVDPIPSQSDAKDDSDIITDNFEYYNPVAPSDAESKC